MSCVEFRYQSNENDNDNDDMKVLGARCIQGPFSRKFIILIQKLIPTPLIQYILNLIISDVFVSYT